MALLPIILHPDPVLRKRAEPVTEITPDILKLLDDMLETMYDAPGIGLAAPQVSISKRLVVIDIEGRDGKGDTAYKMINPKITAFADIKTELEEGCLSLPDMACVVTRPEQVTITYMDVNGKEHELNADGLLAKAIQHELDHLDGKLIFDYLSPIKRDITLRRYLKMLKKEGL